MEHIKVYEEITGMKPASGWEVHHIDHEHENNDPENLIAIPRFVHSAYHANRIQINGNLIKTALSLYWIDEICDEFYKSLKCIAKCQNLKSNLVNGPGYSQKFIQFAYKSVMKECRRVFYE